MKPTAWVELTIPSSTAYLALVSDCSAAFMAAFHAAGDSEAFHAVQLAVHETLVNVIKHAYASETENTIRLRFELRESMLTIHLYDTGAAFMPPDIPPPNLDEPNAEGGLGLFLIRSLMDETGYESREGTNHTWLVKKMH